MKNQITVFPYKGAPAVLVTRKQRTEAYQKSIDAHFVHYRDNFYLITANLSESGKAWAKRNCINLNPAR